MSSWSQSVGTRITAIRTQRGISLSALAKKAGMSKATLSGVEAGTGNPTLDTVERLALALAIPVADILVTEAPRTRVVRGRKEPATAPDTKLLARVSGSRDWEFWTLRLPAGDSFTGVPHAPGTVEIIRVTTGVLTAGPDGEAAVLEAGDLVEFAGDCAHSYLAGPDGAEAVVALGSTAETPRPHTVTEFDR